MAYTLDYAENKITEYANALFNTSLQYLVLADFCNSVASEPLILEAQPLKFYKLQQPPSRGSSTLWFSINTSLKTLHMSISKSLAGIQNYVSNVKAHDSSVGMLREELYEILVHDWDTDYNKSGIGKSNVHEARLLSVRIADAAEELLETSTLNFKYPEDLPSKLSMAGVKYLITAQSMALMNNHHTLVGLTNMYSANLLACYKPSNVTQTDRL